MIPGAETAAAKPAQENPSTPRAWYALPGEDIFDTLDSSPTGLGEALAQERLEQYGPNEIEFRKTPAWVRFLRQFNDPMVMIQFYRVSICV